jgi:membrane protein DedA with SNARE-associated domain
VLFASIRFVTIDPLIQLIQDYGYLIILVWTFVEGETIVIVAGFAAQLGYLELAWVIVAAIAGSFSGDQLWYYLGRHWGPKIIARRLSWQASADRVYRHLHRHKNFLILTFRFYYGLRNVTPFVVGSSQVGRTRFFVLNLIGAIIWAVVFASAGFFSGEAMDLLMIDVHHYEIFAFGGLLGLAFVVWMITLVRNRRRARETGMATIPVPPPKQDDSGPASPS